MSEPWLSVVIPTHNGARWFSRTLQALADQDDTQFECIVVDSSSDETLEVAAGFSSKLCIRTHRRPDLLSWTAKTNFAVSQAQARYVCMLHQDDLWGPGRAG